MLMELHINDSNFPENKKSKCGYGTSNQNDLFEKFFNNRVYKCPVCPKEYDSLDSFKMHVHMRMYCGKNIYSCPICNHYFSTTPALILHLKCALNVIPVCCYIKLMTPANVYCFRKMILIIQSLQRNIFLN